MKDPSKDFQSRGEGASPALSSLTDLRDFTVADGDPDVRGWDAFTGEGRRIGEVHDLLVDTAAMKVRYLDVHLDRELLSGQAEGTGPTAREHLFEPGPIGSPAGPLTGTGVVGVGDLDSVPGMSVKPEGDTPTDRGEQRSLADHLVHGSLLDEENQLVGGHAVSSGSPISGDRHVLIPIGRARLDRQADRILVDSLRTEDILDLPDYDHGPISREHEASLLQRFDRGYVHAPERDFYSHSLYDDESFYSNRRRQSGAGHTENGRREETALNSRGIR
jgi:hypothetical protein